MPNLDDRSKSLDSIFKDFQLDEDSDLVSKNMKCIAIWLPESYKKSFDELQDKTNRKFGRKIKELIIRSIQKVAV